MHNVACESIHSTIFFLLLFFLFHLFDYAIRSYLTAKEELEQQNTMLRKEGSLEVKKAE